MMVLVDRHGWWLKMLSILMPPHRFVHKNAGAVPVDRGVQRESDSDKFDKKRIRCMSIYINLPLIVYNNKMSSGAIVLDVSTSFGNFSLLKGGTTERCE